MNPCYKFKFKILILLFMPINLSLRNGYRLAANGLHWRSTWEFIAGLPGADDKLKREVKTTD